MSKLLDQLNEKQKEAVLQTEGSVLILAGAGSGKTRALTFRVAYLIHEKKVPPKNILAVTFTNKAAQEMTERVKELLGLPKNTPSFSQYLPHIGTFHSTCVKILRKEIEKIGYKSNFVIYDDQDQLAAMKRVMKELDISEKEIKPKAILWAISDAKNKLIDEKLFAEQAGSFFEEKVADCFVRYAHNLKEADALDFDDLILKTVQVFSKYPEVLEKYQNLFRYVMVDEYQDTNHAQYTLLKLLVKKHKNLCVVGDDWQSIYAFRGADVKNILDFEKDYPEAKVVYLEQNYRSTQNILDAAHSVISKNINRKDKKLWTENDKGHPLTFFEALNEKDESFFVAKEIEKIKNENKGRFSDFAVLYRTNAQSRALEEAFLKINVPYKIIGGVKFYQRKEIKDILAYLRFIENSSDKVSLERIINVPARGLGAKTVEVIFKVSAQFEGDFLKTLQALVGDLDVGLKKTLQPKKKDELKKFSSFIGRMKEFAKENPVSRTIEKVYEQSGYQAMLEKAGEEGVVRDENIQELLTVAKKYDDEEDGFSQFLEEVALVSQTDEDLNAKDMVPLMTFHSAKGLEYKTIFMVGMEEGLFPHSRATLNEKELEEERRLCYVGITRAREKAFLLHTVSRSIYGSTQVSIKSRFLDEINDDLIEEKSSRELEDFRSFSNDFGSEKKYDDVSQDSFFEEKILERELDKEFSKSKKTKKPSINFNDGDRVIHQTFGSGVVVSQTEEEIDVAFAGAGLKKFSKEFVPLKKA